MLHISIPIYQLCSPDGDQVLLRPGEGDWEPHPLHCFCVSFSSWNGFVLCSCHPHATITHHYPFISLSFPISKVFIFGQDVWLNLVQSNITDTIFISNLCSCYIWWIQIYKLIYS